MGTFTRQLHAALANASTQHRNAHGINGPRGPLARKPAMLELRSVVGLLWTRLAGRQNKLRQRLVVELLALSTAWLTTGLHGVRAVLAAVLVSGSAHELLYLHAWAVRAV